MNFMEDDKPIVIAGTFTTVSLMNSKASISVLFFQLIQNNDFRMTQKSKKETQILWLKLK